MDQTPRHAAPLPPLRLTDRAWTLIGVPLVTAPWWLQLVIGHVQ